MVVTLIILYLCIRFFDYLGDIPVIFKNVSIDNRNDLDIFFRILLYRGYAIRGKGDGRLFFESELNHDKKLIVRKYNFRNEIGLIIYIPLYSNTIEKRINKYLKDNQFHNAVWKETRNKSNKDVIGLDIKQDTFTGVDIFFDLINIVFGKEENFRLYFKYTDDLNKHYDFDLKKEERDELIRSKLNIPVSWGTNLGYKLGKLFYFWRN